jgi:hypothetical protein
MKKSWHVMVTAAAVAGLGIFSQARAGSVSDSTSPPSTNILASQLVDLGPGAQDSNGDYTDNSGPVGETFTVSTNALVNSLTVLGNGDDSLDPTLNFHFEIGTVDPITKQITQLRQETAPEVASSDHDFLTFTFGTPVSVSPGTTYEFSIYTETQTPGVTGNWYGLAHSAPGTHPGNGGSSFNYDISTVNHDNNTDGLGKNAGFPSPGFVALNVNNYEYAFAIQGTPTPEPGTAALFVAAALLSRRRR